MEHKDKCRKYYTDKKGYICFFCKIRTTRDSAHNHSMEHLIKMSEGLNVPIELITPKDRYGKTCKKTCKK